MQLFDEELKEREDVARYYNKMLKNIVKVPNVIKGTRSAWAQYTIQIANKNIREVLINKLKTQGIPSMIYYENPLHLQATQSTFQNLIH